MIRGRGRRDKRLRNRPFLRKNQKFVRAGPIGHRCRRGVGIGGEGRRGGGGEGRGGAARVRTELSCNC